MSTTFGSDGDVTLEDDVGASGPSLAGAEVPQNKWERVCFGANALVTIMAH